MNLGKYLTSIKQSGMY